MKIGEVESALRANGFKVEVRPTKALFPHATKGLDPNHHSLVCQSHADQLRVHHWIMFKRPDFEGFDCWAAYVEAITDTGMYSSNQFTFPRGPTDLPPGLIC